jgi:hypothetical protein
MVVSGSERERSREERELNREYIASKHVWHDRQHCARCCRAQALLLAVPPSSLPASNSPACGFPLPSYLCFVALIDCNYLICCQSR